MWIFGVYVDVCADVYAYVDVNVGASVDEVVH